MSLADFGRTAAIVTIGDEVVEGRVSNQNAEWLSGQLLRRGFWPRLVIAVPDDEALIVRLLRIAADSANVVIICGGLGFTPDDITRRAVAGAFFRSLAVDQVVASAVLATCTWATSEIADAIATFPRGAVPVLSACGGVPGFHMPGVFALPGSPREMRSMFSGMPLPVNDPHIVTATLSCTGTEDTIHDVLLRFEEVHSDVRLGSYPDYECEEPSVGIVLASRSSAALEGARTWLITELRGQVVSRVDL